MTNRIKIIHQSIPPVPIPPGNCGAFVHVVRLARRWGIHNFITARGRDICVPRGDPRAFDRRVFESAMEEIIGNDEASVENWLVRQGLDKLVDDFLKYFFSILVISSSLVST